MTKVIAYHIFPKFNVSICFPCYHEGERMGMNADEYLTYVIQNNIPQGTDYSILDASEIPQDYYYQNAWVLKDGKITVDEARARQIHEENLYCQAENTIEILRKEMMKADALGYDAEKISFKNHIKEILLYKQDMAYQAAYKGNIKDFKNYKPSCFEV